MATAFGLEQGDLTEQQFHELKSAIKQNADVFALEDSELGCTSVVQHETHTGDHPPLSSLSGECLLSIRRSHTWLRTCWPKELFSHLLVP